MASTFEFWLCNDSGQRIYLFRNIAYCSYSRSTIGYGSFQIGLPYDFYIKENVNFFRPDWRVDVWRSPGTGIPTRREGSFLLRKFQVYTRTTDNMRMVEFFGRSPLDILRRQHYKGTADLTDNIDDLMKAVVRAQFVTTPSAYSTAPTTGAYTYTGEFACDADAGDGPSVTDNFYLKNVLDICTDLHKSSLSLNTLLSTNKRIYFDVVEDDGIGLAGGFGYRFRTFPVRRGGDRTSGIVFSEENGNLSNPSYFEDYLNEWTSVFKYNSSQSWASQNAQNADEQYLSRWNYIEKAETTGDEAAASALNDVYATLRDGAAKVIFNAEFMNSPGSSSLPRSLYGVDWDLGDLLPVNFAGKVLSTEVAICYISVNEKGEEKITGKTQVGV